MEDSGPVPVEFLFYGALVLEKWFCHFNICPISERLFCAVKICQMNLQRSYILQKENCYQKGIQIGT